MKNIKYYGFTLLGDFEGRIEAPIDSTEISVNGDICYPSETIKLAYGSDAWSQDEQQISLLSGDLIIKTATFSDWTYLKKEEWLKAYMNYCGLSNMINNTTHFNTILQVAENQNLFEKLSGSSIAYATKDNTSGEVSIGMNVYLNRFIRDYALTLPNNSAFRNAVLSLHKTDNMYVSNVAIITYLNQTEMVYCFDGINYNYDLSQLPELPSLTTGGGTIFGEVKLAGNGIKAYYTIKKNIDKDDPTVGLCSGEGAPFCIGDELTIIDKTVWTTYDVNDGWTWKGDFTNLPYTWYIADITNPCVDYKNEKISNMAFPLRVIQFCKFGDFG